MENYRLWYTRNASGKQGPFPEPLVCRFILLGRLHMDDEVSLDGSFWHQAGEVPELARALREMLAPAAKGSDPQWAEERARAVMRWLDDRKLPDPRGSQESEGSPHELRSGKERRHESETLEQHIYREGRGAYMSWMHSYGQRHARKFAWLLAALLGASVWAALYVRPVNPVKVGLRLNAVDCAAEPARDVRWSGCSMDGAILAGADLRSAELVGTSLRQAKLDHADLTGANLLRADITGADLSDARLDAAIWIDGRVCGAGSLGRCR